MATPNFESHPEKNPMFQTGPDGAVSELTGLVLANLAEEFALDGGIEETPTGRAFQGTEILNEDSTMYVVRYYTEAADEVPVGEKMIDVVVADRTLDDASTRPEIRYLADITPAMRPKYVFTNYYIVNNGLDEHGYARHRVGRSVLNCAYSDLLRSLADNHRPASPTHALEHELGLHVATEAEVSGLVAQLAGLLERKTLGA